ncbi:MAG: hypothetical protein WD490_00705 [Opitutales bacterium]
MKPRRSLIKDSPWLLLSILLHLAVIVGMGLFARERINRREARESVSSYDKLSRETLEKASEKLKEINRDQLEQNLGHLKKIEEEMKTLREQQAAELAAKHAERPLEARKQSLELLERILEEQQALLGGMEELAPRLKTSGGSLVEEFESEREEAELLTSAAEGEALKRLERVAALYSSLTDFSKRVTRIQELQVRLSEELAWLNQTQMSAIQDRAISAQVLAENKHGQTRGRMEWLRRDLAEFGGTAERVLKETNTHRRSYHLRQLKSAMNRQIAHVANLIDYHDTAAQAEKDALQAQLAVKHALEAIPPPDEMKPEDFLAGDEDRKIGETAEAEMNFSDMKLSELFTAAVDTEKRVDKLFTGITATAAADAGGKAPSTTGGQVQGGTPDRSGVNAKALDGEISSGAEFQQHQNELGQAVSTSTSMVMGAEIKLISATGAAAGRIGAPPGTELAGTESGDEGETGESGDETDGGEAGETGGAIGGPPGTVWSTAGHGLGELTGGPAKSGEGGGEPGDGTPSAKDPEAERKRLMAGMRSGRTVSSTVTDEQPWIFINGWYMIGPFTTGDSTGLNRSYTPENVVNLDGVYSGPDGRTLKWEYRIEAAAGTSYFPVQNGNSVYYAFTHVKADRDMTVWMALASDDASRVWLNDVRIPEPEWHGNEQPWIFSFGHDIPRFSCHLHYRGYRQVRLRQGINTLLIRVENGPGGTGYAVYMRPTG